MYCAPEIVAGSRYNTGVDVYSYAVTLFECACGGSFARNQFREISRYGAAASGWRPKPTEELVQHHPLVWVLIQECWAPVKSVAKGGGVIVSGLDHDVSERPTFTEIVTRLELMVSSEQLLLVPLTAGEADAARAHHRDSSNEFACYLSHHKQASAAEARLVKPQLEAQLGAQIYFGKCAMLLRRSSLCRTPRAYNPLWLTHPLIASFLPLSHTDTTSDELDDFHGAVNSFQLQFNISNVKTNTNSRMVKF